MGKDQLITFLLCVNNSLAIESLEILEYREPYGGEVRNKSWQIQFRGKRPGDAMRAGREIKNITGATISARAVTNGVHRLLLILHAIRNRLPRNLATTQ
jgi:Na+-translocating ferredoxin:NAD+ oxidoreductase RnfG subunit